MYSKTDTPDASLNNHDETETGKQNVPNKEVPIVDKTDRIDDAESKTSSFENDDQI